jgi:hypothetical protein
VTGVDATGTIVKTKSRSYVLVGELCRQLCPPSVPNFVKIAFRVCFAQREREIKCQRELELILQS